MTGRGLFRPILAGATPRDRALACVGALLAIAFAAAAGALLHGAGLDDPWIVAPIGASAVLVFAVPSSPMAQPWPVIGGNAISALVGVAVAHAIPDRSIAAGVAVGLAIAVMSVTRTLHPPGGAAALTAVLGGPVVADAGWLFPLLPVALNAAALAGAGWIYHRLSGHAYPHRAHAPAPATADRPSAERVGFRSEDLDRVLHGLGEAFDVRPEDLETLVREVERQALVREHGEITCADVMSRDVVHVAAGASPADARRLLLRYGVRALPVIDEGGHVVGAVGLRDLARPGRTVRHAMAPAFTAGPSDPVIGLTGPLTDGHHHAAIVVDGERRLLGLVSQTDLLAVVTRELAPVYAPTKSPGRQVPSKAGAPGP